ncbi:flagellar biosynthesis protein FlhF [Ideonella sp. A 288]|uniref:flagellar biosynthesis protein FlhF n=1 Tax=Ideonella sp. A 288 TaxID=1962181 RepID=UPI000B4AB799|nr:flagellar biosynthesis protein FlhF [Ideonella sp. A 288]
MNVKRFTAKTSREALALVRSALGDDAVVLSTRPGADGVEVLAMAPDGMQQLEAAAAQTTLVRASTKAVPTLREEVPGLRQAHAQAQAAQRAPQRPTEQAVDDDVQTLGMSTLTFQDYVRERMLKRRQVELDLAATTRGDRPAGAASLPARQAEPAPARMGATPRRELPVLREEIRLAEADTKRSAGVAAQRDHSEMIGELRAMKSLIEERFGMLAFMEKLQRNPRQAELAQKLLDTGLSPALIRKIVQGLPAEVSDEMAWAASVLERNVLTDEHEIALEDCGGVFALIGSTGVGKTTSTAKIAAAFAARHGAAQLGLITLDAYRVAAHEQLRTYGRILGVPVHTAHDRASLEDLLELLAGKKMVLIDTAGMAQRDTRTRELLEMLSHPSIQKLLVINAAAQGETVEDVMVAYGAAACRGVIVSKLDEAVKLGPALDALIRHKCKVIGVANGQRVPEDWHRLSAQALVQRAMRGGGSSSWRLDAGEVNLLFAGRHAVQPSAAASVARA